MLDSERTIASGDIVRTFALRTPLAIGEIFTDPHEFVSDTERLSAYARRIAGYLPADLVDNFELLKLNMLSALHVRNAFTPPDPLTTPSHFIDGGSDPHWWSGANTTTAFAQARGIALCSYGCENGGRLFVHLVPSPGEGVSATKSRSKLSGHTDASVLPFPGEAHGFTEIAPSPDLVILACIRNPQNVETRVAPLSRIVRGLSAETARTLREPIFDFRPQASFAMYPEFVSTNRPVLITDEADGQMIRFSHSNVSSVSEVGHAALADLKAAIAGSFQGLVLQPGDVLFVNNRTALHGRSEVPADGERTRWILRTYGMYARAAAYAMASERSFALWPREGGPGIPQEQATEA